MLKGFKDFILRGNVVELAVAVVIGVAFGAVVNSVVTNLITPLIALVGGTPDFSQIRTGPVLWGNLINDVLAFLITAAVVYFVVVVPMTLPPALLRKWTVSPPTGALVSERTTVPLTLKVSGVPVKTRSRRSPVSVKTSCAGLKVKPFLTGLTV